ncbi:MAG: rod shape-determining protein MreC [Terriglobia bacterium]
MMLEVNSSLNPRPVPPRPPETPEVMQAFVGRHVAFFLLIAVLLAQIIFLGYQVTRKHKVRLIKVWAVGAFDPFERAARGLTDATAGAVQSIGSVSSVRRKNKQLRQELAEVRAEALQLSEEGAENEQLRALLDLQRRLPLRTVSAAVIAASPGTGSAIFIDRGTADGLITDQPVITPDGVVGKTVAVFRHTAQVLLITDLSSGAGAMLQKSGDEGVLKGNGEGRCVLNYITNGTLVSPGDRVLTSGLDQIYPKGLLLGTVASIHRGNIYAVIAVKPAANMDRLDDVLVVLPDQPRTKSKGREPINRR